MNQNILCMKIKSENDDQLHPPRCSLKILGIFSHFYKDMQMI